ncbi:MAG TPA: hypothetical protein ENJ18_00715 [Nannocystis exedens]|nr:hypothetical protein [Nannocystis exedens]
MSCPDLVRVAAPADHSEDLDVQATPNSDELAVPPAEPTSAGSPTYAAPWSGRHLSEIEAGRLMRSSPARVVGVIGPRGAGKTCLLTSFFLLLADGKCADLSYRFAASRSLFAFQTVGHQLSQWDGHTDGQMVAHTQVSTKEEQEPGAFLHVGLRPRDPGDNRLIDLLLCDIAGEYFEKFSSLADSTTQERMAFLRRCNTFVLVVDGPALVGTGGRKLDSQLARMLGRIIDTIESVGARERPPIVVAVSKVDDLSPEKLEKGPKAFLKKHGRRIMNALGRARDAEIPCECFAVSAIPKEGQPQGVSELFCHVLGGIDKRTPWPPICVQLPEHPFPSFLAHRRWRQDT